MTEKTEKIEPKQAAEGMTLVALCKQCGESGVANSEAMRARRCEEKHLADPTSRMRSRWLERKAEAAKPKNKAEKPSKKGETRTEDQDGERSRSLTPGSLNARGNSSSGIFWP